MNQPFQKQRRELYGEPISSGIGISKSLVFKQIPLDALEMNAFPTDNIGGEFERLDRAFTKSREQLIDLAERLVQEKRNANIHEIFKAQMQILDDRTFEQELKSLVRARKMNVEHVIATQIRVLENRFASIHDEVIRTKFLDIQDVYNRLLRNLLEIEHVRTNPMQRVNNQVIFVSERLVPSDVALLDFKNIVGIIIEEGSKVSHVAVISKSLEIPAIINVPGAGSLIHTGDIVIVDGYTGKLIVNPTTSEIVAFKEKREHSIALSSRHQQRSGRVCETSDGRRIRLEANIGSIREAEIAMSSGAEGIGLLRSELFYLSCNQMPSPEEEINFYKKVLALTKRKPVTIRLLDLGADKTVPYLHSVAEENPQLGIRGIRYLLRYPDLFSRHIESVLNVCSQNHVKIALPFISSIEDYQRGKEFIKKGCEAMKVDFESLHIGIMVEIPSAALSIRSFLSEIDFINIGTNDLIQYTFAASREDGNLEQYRQSHHPVIIRMIKNVVSSANLKEKEVSICGEMASDIGMAALLVGAGATSLSMPPSSIPVIRQFIERQMYYELQKLTRKVLSANSAGETQQLLNSFLESKL